jgi:RNA polymerase sigma-70 factor (ECF subfamily)
VFFGRDKQLEGIPATGEPVSDGFSGEEALVAAARGLGTEAWAEIYRRHAEQVYAYIFYRIGDRTAAEDLAADVFVRAIAGIQRYEWRGTPLLAWLYRIAHNVTADHRKAAARRSARETAEAPDEIEERVDHLQALDERSDMMRAIRSLTDDQQQVLLLRFYGGMSNTQVSKVVGKPETAVKALQARGLRSLRRILNEGERRIA